MKKILALILCLAMALSTMSFSVFAADEPAERAINIEVDYDEVYAEDLVVVSVVLDGENMANAEWKLSYETDKFELQGVTDAEGTYTAKSDNTGIIDDFDFLRDGSVYNDGAVLRKYTFKAIAQTEETEATFGIGNTYAYTYLESINATNVTAGNNDSLNVTILLIDYVLDVKVDGESTSETSWNKPYDNEEHTFEVITDPAATVTYKVNGEEVDDVVIKGEGTYTIEYTVATPEIGYAPVTETFTMTVEAPEYVIEVTADYVDGKALVLVYTQTDGVYFTYDGNPMVDVSEAGYKFEELQPYEHVFGFVTDGLDASDARIPEATLKAPVAHEYTVDYSEVEKVEEYDFDLNLDGEVELRDVTTAFGVYNVNVDYFTGTTYMKKILKADINRDKHVEGQDTGAVYNAFLYD